MEIKRLSTILKLIANPERMAILFLLLEKATAALPNWHKHSAPPRPASPTTSHACAPKASSISRATTASSNTASSLKKPPPSSIPCARSKTQPNKQIIPHRNIKAV